MLAALLDLSTKRAEQAIRVLGVAGEPLDLARRTNR